MIGAATNTSPGMAEVYLLPAIRAVAGIRHSLPVSFIASLRVAVLLVWLSFCVKSFS